jgi:hypothetical protein
MIPIEPKNAPKPVVSEAGGVPTRDGYNSIKLMKINMLLHLQTVLRRIHG